MPHDRSNVGPLFLGVMAVLLTLFLPPTLASANDASFYGQGATVFAYSEHRVRMAEERIRIRFETDRQHRRRPWVAHCEFVFENLTDAPVTVQMGFPDWRAFGDGSVGWAIDDFTVRVKGKPVSAKHKKVDDDGAHRYGVPPPQVLARKVKLGFHAAYTWPVRFAAREKLTVYNRYRFGGVNTNGPLESCVEGEPPETVNRFFWNRAPMKTLAFANGVCFDASYVVTTGKTWAGVIGHAVIEIQIPPGVAPHHVLPFPAATQLTASTVRWEFHDFSPSRDLRVVFTTSWNDTDDGDGLFPRFETVAQTEAWLDYARDNGVDWSAITVLYDAQRYAVGAWPKGLAPPELVARTRPPVMPPTRSPNSEDKKILARLRRAAIRAALPGFVGALNSP